MDADIVINKPIGFDPREGEFYGYPVERNGAFGNTNLQVTDIFYSGGNQGFYAEGKLFNPDTQKYLIVELLCNHADQTIGTVRAQSDLVYLDRKFLFYQDIYNQYTKHQNDSIFRIVGLPLLARYKANQGHYCYMVEDVYSNNRFNALDIKQLAQENSQVFKNMLDQLRNAILFAKSLGWYYNLKHDCVRFNSNAQVLIDCFDNTYNMNHGVDKKAMVFITQDYNRIIKLYFQHVFSEAGFSKNQLDLMTAQYVDGLLFKQKGNLDKRKSSNEHLEVVKRPRKGPFK
ncbi:hypothetical protein BDF19DRAFT_415569 [Syncephalis fuscata]|nr:hypothetical protein BDF19DRAFT_415569 [Syncephalis fuscata]